MSGHLKRVGDQELGRLIITTRPAGSFQWCSGWAFTTWSSAGDIKRPQEVDRTWFQLVSCNLERLQLAETRLSFRKSNGRVRCIADVERPSVSVALGGDLSP
jgi:hypothetical protein